MGEGANAELEAVKGDVLALRRALEAVREEATAAAQRAHAEHQAEVEQLRAAIVAARRQADELQQQHDDSLAEQARRFDVERRELHDTITELRRRLETTATEARR